MRLLLILTGLVGLAATGYLALYRAAYRRAMRAESSYNSEMEQLHGEAERRLRDQIDKLRRPEQGSRDEKEITDRLFESLGYSELANNSREVERWRKEPDSPERNAIALKWARVAADEAAYKRELHRRWRRNYERGVWPHHITADEVKPFAMPEGWTSDDWKWGRPGSPPDARARGERSTAPQSDRSSSP
jgi:hypothetical protein